MSVTLVSSIFQLELSTFFFFLPVCVCVLKLAEGAVEDDLAWTNHPSGGEIDQQVVQHVQPSVPERKNRIGRLLRSEPVSGGLSSFTKPRSVSLSRTEESAIREAPIYPSATSSADPNSSNAAAKPSAGSSSVKLARSKSSVEKKIQHEVAVFWRRTKEGKLFQKKENPEKERPTNADQVCTFLNFISSFNY